MKENEKIRLLSIDLKVIKNARKIAEHIGKIYDFTRSNHPSSFEWWWHLDKIADGQVFLKGLNIFLK
jgi:hypothetical protein